MDIKYLAGFFDGEDCITVKIIKREKTRYKTGIEIRPCISIIQKNITFLKYLQNELHIGRIDTKANTPQLAIEKPSEIRKFLTYLKDELELKKDQATLMLTLLDLKEQRCHLSNEGFDECMNISREIHRLNSKD